VTTSAWVLSVRKELRALLPALVASVAGIVAVPMNLGSRHLDAFLWTYAIGALAIGAISVGHEYTYRTLSFVLARPVSRRAVLGAKAIAVAMALAMLLVTLFVRVSRAGTWADAATVRAALVLPLLGAASVAPWLTMVFRSTLAGMVFTVALPTMAALVAWMAITLKYGIRVDATPEWAQMLPFHVLWGASIVLALVGAAIGWRQFMVLEAIDGPGAAVTLPRWLARSEPASQTRTERRSVFLLLLAKELRLQHMSVVVAALFLAVFAALWLTPLDLAVARALREAAAGLYGVIFVALAGALACAEEHRLGTVAWQVLLPVSATRQWAVKVAVVVTLSLGLGCVLPAALLVLADGSTHIDWNGEIVGLVILASCATLYLSSVSKDGVRAVLLIPAVAACFVPVAALVTPLGDLLFRVAFPYVDAVLGSLAPEGFSTPANAWIVRVLHFTPWVIFGGVALLLLRAAFQNYRTGDWSARRITSQVAPVVAWLAAALVLAGVWGVVQTDSTLRKMWARCRQPGGAQCSALIEDGPPFANFTNSLRPSSLRRMANPQ
jgi:hypothetical protein